MPGRVNSSVALWRNNKTQFDFTTQPATATAVGGGGGDQGGIYLCLESWSDVDPGFCNWATELGAKSFFRK